MKKTNPRVDAFLSRPEKWQQELTTLRTIVLKCQLTEELKWGLPCYTLEGSNIVILQPFKEYCALMFFKGALLRDASGVLKNIGKNTQAGRQIRFTSADEIIALEPVVKAYIQEAIEVEKAGLKVAFKKASDFPVPEEFQARLDSIPALKSAFEALTPGRQKAYLLHFSAPKLSKTRAARVEKWLQPILDGKGLDD